MSYKVRAVKLLSTLLAVCIICGSIFVGGAVKVSAASYSTAYPNTWINTGNQIEDLIGVAMTQVGYYGTEWGTGTKYGAWFGPNMTYQPWCGMFVSWCASQAGIPTSVILKNGRAVAYAYSGTYHYKDGYTPKRGDLVLYNPSSSGGYYFPSKDANGRYSQASHVAIVCSYDASTGKIWVVHGNATDSKVCYNSVSVSKNSIQAFVTPPYTTGPSAPVDSDYVNGDSVNVRSGPSINDTKIGMVDYGTPVNVLEAVTDSDGDKWYKVEIPSLNITGYIFGEYVTLKPDSEPETAKDTVNGNNVRVRNAPSTTGTEVLTEVNYGQVVTLLEVAYDENEDKWYKISFVKDGVSYEGYIFGEYVNVVNEPQEDPLAKANYVNGDAVRLREEPSLDCGVKTLLNYGQMLNIINVAYDTSSYKWYKTTLQKDGTSMEGYVAAEFVTVNNAPSVEFSAQLESPSDNSSFNTSEKVTVSGWAFTNLGNAGWYYKVDGGQAMPFNTVSRSDIATAYSESCPNEQVGFSAEIKVSDLSVGEHTLEVIVTGGVTEKSLGVKKFNVTDQIVLSFDASGGENAPQAIANSIDNTQFSIPASFPYKENCYFKGWSANKDSAQAQYLYGGSYAFESSCTLYAVWGDASTLKTGDVDCNGTEDAIDLALIKKCISGLGDPINLNIDINKDLRFSVDDFAFLKKLIAGV